MRRRWRTCRSSFRSCSSVTDSRTQHPGTRPECSSVTGLAARPARPLCGGTRYGREPSPFDTVPLWRHRRMTQRTYAGRPMFFRGLASSGARSQAREWLIKTPPKGSKFRAQPGRRFLLRCGRGRLRERRARESGCHATLSRASVAGADPPLMSGVMCRASVVTSRRSTSYSSV